MVVLGYLLSSRPAWAVCNTASKTVKRPTQNLVCSTLGGGLGMTLPLRLRKVSDGLANPLNTGLLVVYPLTGAGRIPPLSEPGWLTPT